MIAWIGTLAGILLALLVAANNGLQVIGYLAFFIGSIAWFYVSVKNLDKAGMVQWLFFSCVNMWGIFNYVK